MLASAAITLLKSSELKQLGLKVDTPAVLGFINFGILEIHKRFALWQAEAIITQAEDVLLYKLDGIDANVSIDLSDHQLLMIENVFEEDSGEISINDEEDPYGCATPQYHQIEFVESVLGDLYSVIYRAAPVFLTSDTEEIPLPPQFLEALFIFVAYKGHGSIKPSADQGPNNTFYNRFEAACNLINTNGLIAQDSMHSHKFADRGFV